MRNPFLTSKATGNERKAMENRRKNISPTLSRSGSQAYQVRIAAHVVRWIYSGNDTAWLSVGKGITTSYIMSHVRKIFFELKKMRKHILFKTSESFKNQVYRNIFWIRSASMLVRISMWNKFCYDSLLCKIINIDWLQIEIGILHQINLLLLN